jgi:hypothetical protein
MASLTTGPGIPLEQNSVLTLLGIQFWDFTFDNPITDSLQVSAYLRDSEYPPVPAFRTNTGVYAFQGLPCLHDLEYPSLTAAPSSSPPRTFNFVITVTDTLRRFLPTLFGVELPLPYRGLFLSNDVPSPEDSGARAYLFSASTRPLDTTTATVRVDLWDRDAGVPASFAALKILVDGAVWLGIADAHGRALIAFPYPLVQRLALGSPPGGGQGPLSSMSWPIKVEVQYQPGNLSFLLSNTRYVEWPWNVTPSLRSILEGQQPAHIWQDEAGPPVAEWTGDLTYGNELVLRTTSALPFALSGFLLVSRGTSSP